LACRNHELQRRLRLAASAANLQQNLASELKYPSGPAPYMPAAARAWLAPTSCKRWSKSLVSIASNGSATRVAGCPSGRLVDLPPPELADWPLANRHARPFLAVSAAK
jgi:hypothetical protein